MRPTRRAVFVLAAGSVVAALPALGFPRTWPWVLVMWGALGGVLGLDALCSPRRRGLVWHVRCPDVLHVGGRDRLVVSLTIPADHDVPVDVALDLSPELTPQAPASGLTSRSGATFTWDLVPRRRGTAIVERLWIRYASPLGLWSWLERAVVERRIPVLPDVPAVRTMALRFVADREFRAGLKIERYVGDGSEFDSIKEYGEGDDRRSMDWKSSARHRKLLCRQFRAERNHQLVLALDSGHLMSEEIGGLPKLDHAINASLLLAYLGLKSGDQVGLCSFAAKLGTFLAPRGRAQSMAALLLATSRVRYSNDETNFTLGLTELMQRLARRSLVVLFTDFVDTITAELMFENIGRLCSRHLVVFVSLRDPLLARLESSPPATLEGLNRAVVARSFLRDRETVHRRLRRSGVFAIDAEPARIGPALVNQYLDIKRRELV